jgi:hypothetical protein
MSTGWEVVAAARSSTLTNIAATQVEAVRNLVAVIVFILSGGREAPPVTR